MKVSTKRDFFRFLKKSRLLTTAQCVEAKRLCQGRRDAASTADELVQRQLLTTWQAGQLLRGRTRFYLGKYKLLKLCGRGAMGIVFKAEHPEMQRTVAIKILSKSLLNNPQSVSRFLREIRSTAVLNHPNLVVAYDADQIEGTYCLVMEYISGRSLKALSAEHGRLPVLWSCECTRQAALALMHIHERGLVHRDVKPSNMLVTTAPGNNLLQIRLLDIGLARFVSETEEEKGLTRDGQIVGTADYMAPEQVARAKEADIRADIYGLGATLFQLITGAPPLTARTLLQTYINRLQHEPPLLSSLSQDIPPGLDWVVAKMLNANPQDRYQTPDEVVADLASILAGAAPEFAVRQRGVPISSDPLAFLPGQGHGPFTAITGPRDGRSADSDHATDAISQFFNPGPGNKAEGSRSSDVTSDASVNEFLDLIETGPAEELTSVALRRQKSAPPVRIRALTKHLSSIFRALLGHVPGLGTNASVPVASRKRRRKRPVTKSRRGRQT